MLFYLLPIDLRISLRRSVGDAHGGLLAGRARRAGEDCGERPDERAAERGARFYCELQKRKSANNFFLFGNAYVIFSLRFVNLNYFGNEN